MMVKVFDYGFMGSLGMDVDVHHDNDDVEFHVYYDKKHYWKIVKEFNAESEDFEYFFFSDFEGFEECPKEECLEILSQTRYISDVLSQLTCMASDEYKKEHITYEYTPEQIFDNISYFKNAKKNLSAYKALLFFGDYLIMQK